MGGIKSLMSTNICEWAWLQWMNKGPIDYGHSLLSETTEQVATVYQTE